MSETVRQPRLRQNPTERQFQEWAASQGWELLSRGWPDFMMLGPDGELRAVQVSKNGRVSSRQARLMDLLARFCVPCYMWSIAGGFERIVPTDRTSKA